MNKSFYIEVHYAETDIQDSCIKRALAEKTDTVYAIKDTGGIIIENNTLSLFGDVVTFRNESEVHI